jgi:hypothetical protein
MQQKLRGNDERDINVTKLKVPGHNLNGGKRQEREKSKIP